MSDQPAIKTRNGPWRFDRATGTLLLSACLLLLIGLLPRSQRITGNELLYWQEKMSWKSCADMVLAGNSRVYRGLAPHRMGRELNGMRIFNFGFSAVGYSPEYLDAIENVLDPHSHHPAIVLGVSPASLTPANQITNKYLDLRGRSSATDYSKARYLGGFLQYFDPLPMREVYHLICLSPGKTRRMWEEYYSDGWAATRWEPEDASYSLGHNRRFYQDNSVAQWIVDRVLAQVSKWTRQGITVYGIRPPSTHRMEKLENELSGFDEEKFAAAFQAAGGVWLDCSDRQYSSYDGNHLSREAALEFSLHLARKIQRAEKDIAKWPTGMPRR